MVLLNVDIVHRFVVFQEIGFELIEDFLVLSLVLSIIESLINLVKLFEEFAHLMQVACFKVLASNQLLEISNETGDKQWANKGENKKNQDEDQSEIRADILHVIIGTPHFILGNRLPSIQINSILSIALSWLANRLQKHILTFMIEVQLGRLIDISIATVIFEDSFILLQHYRLRPNSLLSKNLWSSQLHGNFIVINKWIDVASGIWWLSEFVLWCLDN